MQRVTVLAFVLALALAISGAAQANSGGVPNANACHGVVVSALASNGYPLGMATMPGDANAEVQYYCGLGKAPARIAAFELLTRFSIEIDGVVMFLMDAFHLSMDEALATCPRSGCGGIDV